MLCQSLDIHANVDKPKDREWINILLSFLKTCLSDSDPTLLMHNDDREPYIAGLIDSLKASAKALDSGEHTFDITGDLGTDTNRHAVHRAPYYSAQSLRKR